MKQPEHSDTTVNSDLESSSSSEHVRKSFRTTVLHGRLLKAVLSVLSVALFITIYVLANRKNHNGAGDGEFIPVVNSRSLEIEVLDCAESMKAAQQLTNYLRAQGYDVVEMKRNYDGVEDRTFIFDRSGKLDAARKLAALLGVSQDKVFQKIDRNLYLDLTVVMGKDYSRLKAFQLSNERNLH